MLEAQALSVGIAGLDTQKEREELSEVAWKGIGQAVEYSKSEEAA